MSNDPLFEMYPGLPYQGLLSEMLPEDLSNKITVPPPAYRVLEGVYFPVPGPSASDVDGSDYLAYYNIAKG